MRSVAALLVVCASIAARAEEATDERAREEAATRFERGVKLFRDGDYQAALGEFEAAHRAVPRWEVLFNVGVTQKKLFRYDDAVRTLARYLADGGERVPAARREEVEREVREIRALVAEVTIRVDGAPAEIAVDGRTVGRTPLPGPILVGGGRHVLRATRPGEEPDERAIDVVSGQRAEVVLAPRAQVRVARLGVTSRPDGAELLVDGRAVGRSPWAGTLDPGGHEVRATLDGHQPARTEIVLTAGQERALVVELTPLPRVAPPVRWYRRWYVWTAVAVVVAGGAAAGIGAWAATRPPFVEYP